VRKIISIFLSALFIHLSLMGSMMAFSEDEYHDSSDSHDTHDCCESIENTSVLYSRTYNPDQIIIPPYFSVIFFKHRKKIILNLIHTESLKIVSQFLDNKTIQQPRC